MSEKIKFWNDLSENKKKLYKSTDYDATLQGYFDNGNYILHGVRQDPSLYTFIKGVYQHSFNINISNNGPAVEFEDCYFLGDVRIIGPYGEGNRTVKFNRCVFEGELSFNITSKKNIEVTLIEIAIKRQLIIFQGNFSNFYSSFQLYPTIKIDGGTYKNFYLGYWGSESEVDSIYIEADKIAGEFTFNKSVVKRFHISGVNKNAELYLENLKVNSLNIYRFRNESKLRIQNITPNRLSDDNDSELVIYDSHLGKSEFYELDLIAFKDVIIHDSFLVDCYFVNIDWPKNIEPTGGKYISDKDKTIADLSSYYKKKKENYRQLKYALSKQGDIVGEHYFHGLEMNAYNNTLKGSWKNFGTKAILFLSILTSDFGQSLWKPFRSLILFNWVLFIIMIVGYKYNNYVIAFTTVNWKITLDALAELLRLTNPLHRNDPEFTGVLLIIDIAMRIWSSYMIYNIIRATRRFIK